MTNTENTERFQTRLVGKNWEVIDTTDGSRVATLRSRRGFPATSLAFRANLQAKNLNDAAARGCVIHNGMAYPPGTKIS